MFSNKFDVETWNELKRTEFLRRGGPYWQFNFNDFSVDIDKLRKRQKYDEVWELIKKKNHW